VADNPESVYFNGKMIMEKNALIAGATGLVGNELLQHLLQSDEYKKVVILVRKPLELSYPKLVQQQVEFDKIASLAPLVPVHDVYCALGTTIKKAGSQPAFRKVDYDYVTDLGKFCEKHGVSKFLVVSAMGADVDSKVFYNRVKGEMEEALRRLNIPSIAIFRPSLLMGKRKEFRLGERVAQGVMGGLGFLFIGGLLKYKPISAAKVARAMINQAGRPTCGFQVVDSGAMQRGIS
jgi:uncharacterized protein YbjT (DUF2867 family)